MTLGMLFFALIGPACVEVDGPRITAGELARTVPAFASVPADTDYGYVPSFGARRVLRAGGEEFCVVRKGRILDKEEVLGAMRRSLPSEAVALELVDIEATPVPAGELSFPLSGLSGNRWRGYVRTADRSSVPIQANVRVTSERRRAYATRDIAAGEVLAADAVEIREERVPGVFGSRLAADDVPGKVATAPIAAGAPIEPRMLRTRPAVAAGDTVSVTVLRGPARLRFESRAQSSARVGDTLLIRSPLNGSLVRAKVAGERAAVVELGEVSR